MDKINMKAAACDDETIFHKEVSCLLRNYMKTRNIEIYTDNPELMDYKQFHS